MVHTERAKTAVVYCNTWHQPYNNQTALYVHHFCSLDIQNELLKTHR